VDVRGVRGLLDEAYSFVAKRLLRKGATGKFIWLALTSD